MPSRSPYRSATFCYDSKIHLKPTVSIIPDMMPDLIILTPKSLSGQLQRFFSQFNKIARICHAATLADLDAAISVRGATSRLISHGTDIIVPAEHLDRLGFGAYNFHPGPPTHPGWAPASFALYDGAEIFGATAHKMTAKVDAGGIIGTQLFAVSRHATPDSLATETVTAVGKLMRRLGPALTTQLNPPPELPIVWSNNRGTRAKFAALRELPDGLDATEKDR